MRDIKRNKKAFSVKAGRCELLCVKFELPESDVSAAKLFNEYYRSIGLSAEVWARKYAGEIKKEYEALGERERKFRFRRYEYCITSGVEPAEGGNISVKCIFRLTRNRNILFEKELSDLWSADSLLMRCGRRPHDRPQRLIGRICSIR